MVASGDELRSLVELVFRQRHEEVLACESVVVIGRGSSNKDPKPRVLALCCPFAATSSTSQQMSSHAKLCVVRVESGRVIKVKLNFLVARLVDVSHDGSFDATFNFGASGMISVAFESHIQREMFIAAVRKVQRDLQPLVSGGNSRDVHAFLTDAVGAEAEADAAARVKSLKQEKRRALTSLDEQRLQHFLGRHSFDDIRGTDRLLSTRQKEAELSSVEALVTSVDDWESVRSRLADLVGDVDELESRISQYSKQILSKKDELQRIEHQNNTLQRKQRNLEKLHEHLLAFCNQLSLPPQTATLLFRLRNTRDEDLVNFFAEGNNAQVLSDAMKHMRSLLHNIKLVSDYPIAAVAERRAFFMEQRRMIAHRSKAFILSTIIKHEKLYLEDRLRYSSRGRLVWRLHTELMTQLDSMRDMITALAHIDLEGFIAVLRQYRVSMQRVYALEIHKFFKCIRTRVKKVNSRGPFLIGVRDSPDEALAGRMETSTLGETPRRLLGANSIPSTPATSWAQTPRNGDTGDGDALSVELPEIHDETLRLYNPNYVHGTIAGGGISTIAPSSYSLKSVFNSNLGGDLRPDLALAMTLETIFGIILQEEEILRRCFGIAENQETITGVAGAATTTTITANKELIPEEVSGSTPVFSSETLAIGEADAAGLLRDSLLELFGGDKLVQFTSNATLYSSRHRASEAEFGGSRTTTIDILGVDNSSNIGGGLGASVSNSNVIKQVHKQNYLLKQLISFAEYCGVKCDRLYAIPVMVMVKAYRREGTRTSSSSFCQAMLEAFSGVLTSTISHSIAEQTSSIIACRKKYIVHPAGMLSCFTKLPAFIQRMEAMHNALPTTICSRSEYTTIALSLVDQSFEALNYVTNLSGAESRVEVKLSLTETIAQRAYKLLDGFDTKSMKRGFIQQYRHHAFFCAFYTSLQSTNCYALDLLRERYESSRMLRDRYEEVYLTRVVLVKAFPEFGTFALVAEDLAQVHSLEELRHHNALSIEAVGRILRCLPKELRTGIPASSQRMKKHFLRDVAGRKEEESFHCTLIQRVWQHFCTLLLQKIDFLESMLKWPVYAGMIMSITRAEVLELLQAV